MFAFCVVLPILSDGPPRDFEKITTWKCSCWFLNNKNIFISQLLLVWTKLHTSILGSERCIVSLQLAYSSSCPAGGVKICVKRLWQRSWQGQVRIPELQVTFHSPGCSYRNCKSLRKVRQQSQSYRHLFYLLCEHWEQVYTTRSITLCICCENWPRMENWQKGSHWNTAGQRGGVRIHLLCTKGNQILQNYGLDGLMTIFNARGPFFLVTQNCSVQRKQHWSTKLVRLSYFSLF